MREGGLEAITGEGARRSPLAPAVEDVVGEVLRLLQVLRHAGPTDGQILPLSPGPEDPRRYFLYTSRV